MRSPFFLRTLPALAAALLIGVSPVPQAAAAAPAKAEGAPPRVVPAPATLVSVPGQSYELTRKTRIIANNPRAAGVAAGLAGVLRRATGFPLPVRTGGPHGAISLS